MVKVEIEVDTLEQLAEALRFDIDAVLLDNMGPEQLAAGGRARRRPGHLPKRRAASRRETAPRSRPQASTCISAAG